LIQETTPYLNRRVGPTSMNEQVAERLESIGVRDHSITAEYRIFGPPGTGKTTNLTRQIRRAVDRFGDDSVLVTSFSKATAVELAGRDTPMDLDRIGTLHSHCFHALGKPAIAEVNVEEWNCQHPRLRITPVSRQIRLDSENPVEDDGQSKDGDYLLQQLNRCRGMMFEPEIWPPVVRDFTSKWNRYKTANGLLDFCDLIEISFREVSVAPHRPDVIVVDEAQDLNRLQLTLIRSWSARAQYLVVAGDDDQTIYAWAGASPDAILNPDIPEDHKVFLKQSNRVPRAVHAVAERLIHQVSRRQQKTYLPRPADGDVRRLSQAGCRSPEYWILKTAERHVKEGKSIMFLASCSYMLRPIIAVLRKNGIPFHNPHRKSNGFWNPLRAGSRHSAANRLLALLVGHPGFGDGQRDWRFSDLALWVEWLRAPGVVTGGATEAISAQPTQRAVPREFLQAVFEPGALGALLASLDGRPQALVDWWRDRLAMDFRKRVQFPSHVAAVRGPQSLLQSPQIVVGTIHSVKGGQADVVYLFPDLSRAGDAQYRQCGPPRDSVIRTFYVGATRARETLYLCSAESAAAVSIY
jgi:DNA helicase II / ATP-dependent DNA helicase PcrA